MEKQFSKRIQKTMREEARKMREEKRVKSGFYQKLTTVILLFVLLLMAWGMNSLNKVYNEVLSQSGINYHNEEKNAPQGNSGLVEALVEPTTARITCYQPTGQKTASGKVPEYGMVAVSNREINFGTEIVIDGKTYIVEDRTNKRIQDEFGMLTVDIFMEEGCDLGFGATEKLVFIK